MTISGKPVVWRAVRSEDGNCLPRPRGSSSNGRGGDSTVDTKAVSPLSDSLIRARRAKPGPFPGEEEIGAERGEGFATFRPKGALQVDVDFLNDRMRKRGVDRIRLAMRPDEAFGLVYSWDNVIANTRDLRFEAWKQLAEEVGKPLPGSPSSLRQLSTASPAHCIKSVLFWASDVPTIASLKDRLSELYCRQLSKVRAPLEGVQEWLDALQKAGVPCAVATSIDRLTLLSALDRMKLLHHFQAFVTAEDGMESMAHRFLSAAVKLDRAPAKCVVFEDDPRGITAAHNCSMKAVALIGTHPAYELKQADLAVSSYAELSVINLRRLFANRGHGIEHMELKKQREEQGPKKRRWHTDTLY
ncbi:unnamed protein product [Closterium sp. Yama58-4]|nr:unnamed protein product [Closterium sp. Yama58-4]